MRRLLLFLVLGLPLAALGPQWKEAADGSSTSLPVLAATPLPILAATPLPLLSATPLPSSAASQSPSLTLGPDPLPLASLASATSTASTIVDPTAYRPDRGSSGASSDNSPSSPSSAEAPATAPDPSARSGAEAQAPDKDTSGARPPSSVFDGNTILAFYGKPGAKSMGILGEYPKEQVANLLFGYAKLYANALIAENASEGDASSSGGSTPASMGPSSDGPPQPGVIPAFYIIYGACWPGGDIGYLKDSVVKDWIEYADRNGILVFLDHQIGKFGVESAMKRLLPWLAYPNVNLAIDPEWRTEDPMRTIGSISADELNQAQSMMSDWLAANAPGDERILVVHQFTEKMITGRSKVRADWPGVRLIHTADGFGSPRFKRSTYAWNAKATNMPRKGFKLFFKSNVPGAGFDSPLLTPSEVISLDPQPELVIYQ